MWGNAYNGKAQRTFYNGHYMASKMEARYAGYIDLLKKAGEIKDWNYQPRIEVYLYGKKLWAYNLDFELIHNDGSSELVEVKGLETRDWKMKWKVSTIIWEKEHPEQPLTLVLEKDLRSWRV